jgi:hypothetical protein
MAGKKPYAIVLGDRIAEIAFSGAPEPKDVDAALREVTGHEAFRLGMSLLIEDRTTQFTPDKAWIEAVLKTVVAVTRQMDNHIAVVVEFESHYGAAQSFAGCAEPHGLIVMPFREIATARNWLLAQQSDSRYFPIPPGIGPQ